MKRDVNVVFERSIPENTIAVDAVIQTVAAEISKIAVIFVSTTPCRHLYGVLCVTEFLRAQMV
jgi:hypothetical protein